MIFIIMYFSSGQKYFAHCRIKVEEYFFDPSFVPYQSSQIKIVLELILREKKVQMKSE
jgi:hypothetical protein